MQQHREERCNHQMGGLLNVLGELRRTPLLRAWVNKGKKKGRARENLRRNGTDTQPSPALNAAGPIMREAPGEAELPPSACITRWGCIGHRTGAMRVLGGTSSKWAETLGREPNPGPRSYVGGE
jgi:hypothetical protein